jgi:pimeloyl-ACP methyl ester carboxylesterase
VTNTPSPIVDERSFGDPSTEFDYPGAVHPARQYHLDANGLQIAVHEWGDADAPPMLLVHGGFDFARTYDVFAPKLADGGWRVVSWDQRGHGDSEHPELYSWDADMRDALTVFDHVSPGRPVPVVGHSKGGALMTQLADAQPFRFTHLVNMDGIPYNRRIPDVAEHERTKMVSAEIAGWLDHRRSTATARRKPGTIDELAQRRGRMNPRLEPDWLKRLVTTGGFESADGWRWKIDPSMRFGGFGPWRPEWTLMRLPGLPMPFLGILGREMEEMGWGTPPEKVLPYMPIDGRCEILEDVGHFVHIERPDFVAQIVLDFVGAPDATVATALGAGS